MIINLDKYQTTLQTVTKCTVLKIPKEGFKKWLDSDITALQQESRLMGEYLLEQARGSRMLLFPSGGRPGGFSADETVSEICRERSHEDEGRQAGIVGFHGIVCKDHHSFH